MVDEPQTDAPQVEPSLAEQAQDRTLRATLKAGLQQKAGMLVAAGLIGGKIEGDKVTVAPETDWDALVEELITSRKAGKTTLGGKELTGKPLEELEAGYVKAEKIAGHAHDAVKENTGPIGGATFGQLFQAFMASDDKMTFIFAALAVMILSMIPGMEGMASTMLAGAMGTLKDGVAPIVANDVAASLDKKLAGDASLGLSEEERRLLVNGTHAAAIASAKGEELPAMPQQVQTKLTPKDRAALESGVEQTVAESFGLMLGADKSVSRNLTSPKLERLQGLEKIAGVELNADHQKALVATLSSSLGNLALGKTGDPKPTTPEAIRDYIQARLTENAEVIGLASAPPEAIRVLAGEVAAEYVKGRDDMKKDPAVAVSLTALEAQTAAAKRPLVEKVTNQMLEGLYKDNQAVIDNMLAGTVGGVVSDPMRNAVLGALHESMTEVAMSGERDPKQIAKIIATKLTSIEEDGLGKKLEPIAGQLATSLAQQIDNLKKGEAAGLQDKIAEAIGKQVDITFSDPAFVEKLKQLKMKEDVVAKVQASVKAGLVDTIINTPNFAQMSEAERAKAYSNAIQIELGKNLPVEKMSIAAQKNFANLVGASVAKGISGEVALDQKALEVFVYDQVRQSVLQPEGEKSLAETIAEMYAEKTKGRNWSGAETSKEDALKFSEPMAGYIADAVAKAVTEDREKLATMTPEEVKQHIGKAVEDNLRAHEKELKDKGLTSNYFSLLTKPGFDYELDGGKTIMDMVKGELDKKLEGRFAELSQAYGTLNNNAEKLNKLAEQAKQPQNEVASNAPVDYGTGVFVDPGAPLSAGGKSSAARQV
jgi:hypothetical protein